MTDASSNLTIARQYSNEIDDVDLWFDNHQDSYQITRVLTSAYRETNVGFQFLVNKDSGNSWCSFLFRQGDNVVSFPVCYWRTTGAYGIVLVFDFRPINKEFLHIINPLLIFTSHSILRYKLRLGLDLKGIELLSTIILQLLSMVPHTFMRHNKKTMEFITKNGVFRLDSYMTSNNNRQPIGRIKTFLSWNDLQFGERVKLQDYYTSQIHPNLIKLSNKNYGTDTTT